MRLAPLLLASCATLPVQAPEATPDEIAQLEAAADHLGLRVDLSEDGALVWEVWEGRRYGELGHGEEYLCGGKIGAVPAQAVIAQEIGHALGLSHEPGTFMDGDEVFDDAPVTRRQRAQMRATLARWRACQEAAR